ncbi:MAG: glycosyltransferase [Chthoniobacter sp.]|nr:glycosyltransferase [Chthoniobacter sp.]
MTAPDSTTPPVTVLMTMFNAEQHVRAAVSSILRQTFADFEFVIVDDGSSDAGLVIVENFGDPRIRLIRNEKNKGQTACLNQGLALARGEFVARQDADDIALPERLARQVARLREDRELVLLGSQAWVIDGAGRFEGTLNTPLGTDSIEWAALFENPFIHASAMFRREAVVQLGGYDESFRICQDYDLWTRVAARCRTANLADRLVLYRHTHDSLSHRAEAAKHEESLRVLQRWAARVFPATKVSAEDFAALMKFRAGMCAADLPAFRRTFATLLAEYRCAHPRARGRDFLRTVALQHAKVARDVGTANFTAGLAELARAFFTDPVSIIQLIGARLTGRRYAAP